MKVFPGGAQRLHFPHLDIPAKDLALLFKSRHPLVVCETVEEKRFEALVRGVAAEMNLPVSTWSAASGLSPSHPADAPKTTDLAVALRHIRTCKGDGVWLLKDPQAHLETPSALRALRETAQEFAGSARTLVLGSSPSIPRREGLLDLVDPEDARGHPLDALQGIAQVSVGREQPPRVEGEESASC